MRIAGKDAVIHKVVFEVRYARGFVYLDRCGSTTDRIMTTYPEWVAREEGINPQGAPLVNVQSGTHFSFGPLKYDFSLDQSIREELALVRADLDRFIGEVSSISTIVHEELELNQFVREGFRIWYLFGVTSKNEAEKWISDLGAFMTAPSVARAFDGELEAQGHVAVIRAPDRKFRIALNVVERMGHLDLGGEILKMQPHNLPRGQREAMLKQLKAKRRVLVNPEMAVMVDVDAYLEDPVDIDAADFISQSLEMIERQLSVALVGDSR